MNQPVESLLLGRVISAHLEDLQETRDDVTPSNYPFMI